MRHSNKLLSAALVVLLGGALGCGKQLDQLRARNELNRGVRAFEAANFTAAADSFAKALEYDPELLAARTYQATAYRMQYVPGSTSPDNLKVADQALAGFQDVLEKDPSNQLAMTSIASLYFDMGKLDEAKEWNKKLIAAFPDKKEAYYTIGVINWTKSYQPRMELRADLGMRQEDPGPIKDTKRREEFAQEVSPLHDEALQMFNRAVEIDPDYENAMNYINLTYREMADVAPNSEEYERLNTIADDWVQKTLDTRKRLAEASSRDLISAED
jgi:tetratricopeptide (TPR) repeat protein